MKKTHRSYENLRYTKDQGSRDLLQLVFIDLKRREETQTKKESERLKNLSEESLRKLLLPFCSVCVSTEARTVERDGEKVGEGGG